MKFDKTYFQDRFFFNHVSPFNMIDEAVISCALTLISQIIKLCQCSDCLTP
jgi:hypothetical protein